MDKFMETSDRITQAWNKEEPGENVTKGKAENDATMDKYFRNMMHSTNTLQTAFRLAQERERDAMADLNVTLAKAGGHIRTQLGECTNGQVAPTGSLPSSTN